MQTHGGAAAEAVILSSERSIRAEVLVDWNGNGLYDHALSDLSQFADDIVTDRSLQGAAPAEVMLIEGSAAAELTFSIGGQQGFHGMNLVGVFSPYNGLSPLYNLNVVGAEVKYRLIVDTSTGPVVYPQFIGNIRTVRPDRGSNSVAFTALDRVEKLRKPIQHTDWGMLDLQANSGFITGQLMYSHWVIDHCLRFSDTSATPWRWPADAEMGNGTVQIYLSGNGGIAPNIGWVDGSSQNQFADTDTDVNLTMYQDFGQPHPDSPEPTNKPKMFRAQRDWGNDVDIYWSASKLEVDIDSMLVMAFTLQTQNIAGSAWWLTMPDSVIMSFVPKSDRTINVMVGAGQMWIRFIDTFTGLTFNGTKVNIPSGAGNDFVRCRAEYRWVSPSEQIRLTVGATQTATQSLGQASGTSIRNATGRFTLTRKLALQDIIVGTYLGPFLTTPAESGMPAKYAAVLDTGLNRLSFLPKRWGALGWDVIAEVAAAEFGAVFWDESGVFHFWNQDTIQAKKDVFVRTLTLDDISGLSMTTSSDSVRNIYSITAKKARVQNVVVYQAQGPDELIMAPGTTSLLRVWVDNIVTPNSGQPTVYENIDSNGPLPKWDDSLTRFGVVVQKWNGTAWEDILPGGGVWESRMFRDKDGATVIQAWNGNAYTVRFALTGGNPAFRWDGSMLTMFDDQVFLKSDAPSVAKYGPQGLPLASDWYQEFYDNAGMFTKLLARTTKPIPTTDAITTAGDPRLQMGDALKVRDPEGMGEEMHLQVYGIRRSYSKDSGLIDDLTVEMTEPPRIGIWDSPQYGLWDNTFYWSA